MKKITVTNNSDFIFGKYYIGRSGKCFVILLEDVDCACILVEAIAKKSQNIKWATKVDGKNAQHRLIRRVNKDQFYAILSGDNGAFYKMCMLLLEVINFVVNKEDSVAVPNDTVVDELRNVTELYFDLIEELSVTIAVHMLEFNLYIGFNSKTTQKMAKKTKNF